MKRLVTVLFVALAACAEVQTPEPPSPGVIAVCDGLEIAFDDLESQLPTARTTSCQEAQRAEGRGTTEQLIPCFQELAENTALEHLLLAEAPNLDQRITDLLNEQPEIRQIAYIQAWVEKQANELEVTEDEITAFFEAHRDDFLRPRQGQLWNIFRRHNDTAHPEATLEFLRQLKNRCESGESFQSLAREYSHSETRLRDGFVGPLAGENLPPRLQKIAASLGDSEVSEPIRVSGGAILLSVTGVIDGGEPELKEVRETVRQRVLGEKIKDRIAERAATVETPTDAVIVNEQELINLLDDPDPERIVLQVSEAQLTVETLRHSLGLSEDQNAAELDEDGRHTLKDIYRQALNRQLLFVDLLSSTDPAYRDIQEEARTNLRTFALDSLVGDTLHEEMALLLDNREADLHQYFDDNRPHYQSEPAFRLEIWDLDFDNDPPSQLLKMERFHTQLAEGGITLNTAVERLGGHIETHDWTGFSELDFLPNKGRLYLLQAPTGGYSVPFQQHEALHMIHVIERREPEELEFDQVRDAVREDYLERFSQKLAREVISKRLSAGGFTFFPEELRSLLQE